MSYHTYRLHLFPCRYPSLSPSLPSNQFNPSILSSLIRMAMDEKVSSDKRMSIVQVKSSTVLPPLHLHLSMSPHLLSIPSLPSPSSSIQNSICSERGSFSHTHPVKQLLTTPVTQASKTRIGGQVRISSFPLPLPPFLSTYSLHSYEWTIPLSAIAFSIFFQPLIDGVKLSDRFSLSSILILCGGSVSGADTTKWSSENEKSPFPFPFLPLLPLIVMPSTLSHIMPFKLFLCIIGTVIGISICIWLALFSHEDLLRRLLFASAAAFCSFIFILLGIKSLNAEPPEPEQLPDISQERRRSTITGRSLQKKSTAAIMGDDGPNEVLVVSDASRPLVTHH
ncbi:hypothetical protein PRIPAC_81327 [Pristionchus pacificus]|uniref:Uncharacterized protein n=1 Tax=Pristionchus pacificus TaxID=54126 RepID=A0A2A6BYK4_PRIPA|nr:hypothetical protein PRIPAC_81327 [Pristionchus pacificus]|eukprot:PDM70907.1 hypothetical protein PRIPAC_44303 [Pristionchus pacificus]